MCRKQKGLAMNSENSSKIYIIENKIVIQSSAAWVMEKKGVKNEANVL
jgi:hypothetical protein